MKNRVVMGNSLDYKRLNSDEEEFNDDLNDESDEED